jgi:glycosyltransferase involved in cell wall biosynthesis
MTILYVCNEYPPAPYGGIGIFVKTMAYELSKRSFKVIVAGFDETASENMELNEDGVIVYRLKNPYTSIKPLKLGRYKLSFKPFKERQYLSKKIEEIIQKHQPDLIESYDWSGPLWKKPSIPTIIRMHGANAPHSYYEGKRIRKMLYFLENRNLQMADALCAVSRHMGEVTLETFKLQKPFRVLFNSVDTKIFQPLTDIPKDNNLLFYFGRIHNRKGLEELFRAFNIVVQKNPNIRLELAGRRNPDYEPHLIKILSEEARKNVTFLGMLKHQSLPRKINEALFTIMPSRAEAFGLTAIESLSCGVPVIITNKASGPEIVSDRETGYWVDIHNAETFAEAILEAFSNPNTAVQMGIKARQSAEDKFALSKLVEENIDFYKKVLNTVYAV